MPQRLGKREVYESLWPSAPPDPATTARIRRVLAASVVLDTWITGEAEERVSPAADARLVEAEDRLIARAETAAPGFPDAAVSVACLRAACHELLSATALYAAQQCRAAATSTSPR